MHSLIQGETEECNQEKQIPFMHILSNNLKSYFFKKRYTTEAPFSPLLCLNDTIKIFLFQILTPLDQKLDIISFSSQFEKLSVFGKKMF